MAAATVQFLTEHMPHDTPVALRYKELHRAWGPGRVVDDGCVAHRCQGCHTPIRYRCMLVSKIGLAETYVGNTCILVFAKEAPDFVEACQPMLDEGSIPLTELQLPLAELQQKLTSGGIFRQW